jgi:hypothetical protein
LARFAQLGSAPLRSAQNSSGIFAFHAPSIGVGLLVSNNLKFVAKRTTAHPKFEMWFGNALCWYRPEGAILVLPVVSAVSDEEADLGRNSAVATMVAV